jgi:hypothetical protein
MWAVQKAGMTGGGARSSRIGRVGAGLSAALLLTGCTAIQRTAGGWPGATAPKRTPEPTAATPAAAPRVYYAGVEGLKVYSEASVSSKVVGTLSLHEKVTRSKLERGYAYVETARSGLKGWVDNAQLVPRVPTAAAPAPEPQEPSGPEPTPPAEEAPPILTTTTLRAAPPTSTTIPRGIPPSIFNPY